MVSEVVVQSKEDFEAWLEAGGTALSPPSKEGTSSQGSPGEGGTALDTSSEEVQVQGRALFIELGCGACHTLADASGAGAVGPPLDGIAFTADTRVDGMDAHSYILESIINPDDHIVEGFPPGLMPKDYGDRISEEKIEMLVKYLLSQ
jgi:mono/diheme cytochrome c family protein